MVSSVKRTSLVGAFVTASALMLSACSGSSAAGDSDINDVTGDDLVRRAQEEGEVVWYSAIAEPMALDIAAAFEEKYDIPVLVQRSGGTDTIQRFMLEAESGNIQNDLLGPGAGPYSELVEAGHIAPYIPEGAENLEPMAIAEDGSWVGLYFMPVVIPYRTDLVDDVPASWADLIEPNYAGRIGHVDPNFSGVVGVVEAIAVNMGWDWYESLTELDPIMIRTNSNLADSMNSGEVELATFVYLSYAETVKSGGSPIDYVFPEEGTYALVGANAIMAEAPHPYAARLFQQFLIEDEAQQINTEYFNYSVIEGADAPGDLPAFEDIGVWETSPDVAADAQSAVLEQFNAILGIG